MRMVRLKSARGPIDRLVIEEHPTVIVITDTEEYEAARREGRAPHSVGFKKTDIMRELAPYQPKSSP